ncbi:WXG100 family type VII secretion target [Amycolatopsis sp. cmx-4-54]|uniref:WXG100 family type VII secretion target n=1 Tax=Amycolatopsis sp. cmx-4-54 TaxID=2790936 RepID=UPI00397DE7E1
MTNPLVATPKDSTTAVSGVPLLESATELKASIESGDWASVALGSVGLAMDAVSAALDPFGTILAAGVGWLMEHVGPLKEALDALAGAPDEIAAHAETWQNVAGELGSISVDLDAMVVAETANWAGTAGDAYRTRGADVAALIGACQQAAGGASSGTRIGGEVVTAVRTLVRDTIAELIARLISWALQVLATAGIGMTWVLPQVTAAIAKTAAKIATVVTKLIKAMRALAPLMKKAKNIFAEAEKALRKIDTGKTGPAGKPGGPKPGGGEYSGTRGGGGGKGKKPQPKPEQPSDLSPNLGKFDELTQAQKDAAIKMKQWIRDHKDSGQFGAWHDNVDNNKLNSLGLGNNPTPGPGSTWGGRIYGNHGQAGGKVGNEGRLPHNGKTSDGHNSAAQPFGPDGKPVKPYNGKYYEFDVHPTPKYDNKPIRDADQYTDVHGKPLPEDKRPKPDRLVMDENGKFYYAPGHYDKFYEVP